MCTIVQKKCDDWVVLNTITAFCSRFILIRQHWSRIESYFNRLTKHFIPYTTQIYRNRVQIFCSPNFVAKIRLVNWRKKRKRFFMILVLFLNVLKNRSIKKWIDPMHGSLSTRLNWHCMIFHEVFAFVSFFSHNFYLSILHTNLNPFLVERSEQTEIEHLKRSKQMSSPSRQMSNNKSI